MKDLARHGWKGLALRWTFLAQKGETFASPLQFADKAVEQPSDLKTFSPRLDGKSPASFFVLS
jgi:hypothetical protein